ncbi:DUF5133 domain-containing protein [Streptomyces sp. NPDC002589]|uniref:DUF5133 domain-containing protein n=1 Tax=Streptomyces sp. NPDC002589 TaxID=3154420 RepID=UPI00331DB971
MITAHPSLLPELVARCETLRHRLAADHSGETARQLEDATYTQCVITGTRQPDTALSVARRQMTDAMKREQPRCHRNTVAPWALGRLPRLRGLPGILE